MTAPTPWLFSRPRRWLLRGAGAAATVLAGLPRGAQANPAGLDFVRTHRLPVWQPRAGEAARGETLRVDDFRGRWVYLDYWASWCPPCRLSFPWMSAIQARYAACGLEVVTVSVDTREDRIAEFVRRTPAAFWILWDRQSVTAQALQLKAMPSSFLLDPEGRLVAVHQGFGQAQADAIEKTLALVLGPGCKA